MRLFCKHVYYLLIGHCKKSLLLFVLNFFPQAFDATQHGNEKCHSLLYVLKIYY